MLMRRTVRASLGLKVVMAASGAVLLGYLVLHMAGNLKVFFGAEDIDTYAHWLRTAGEPVLPYESLVWGLRVLLLAAVIAHIAAATVLTRRDRAARPVRYVHRPPAGPTYAARTMRWGGVLVALFVVYHVLDLTTGHLNPVGAHLQPSRNLAADFAPERWYVTLFYVLAVTAVGLHLRHGIRSAARTLGLTGRPGRDRAAALVATGTAAVLTAGFLSVPFAVMTGVAL